MRRFATACVAGALLAAPVLAGLAGPASGAVSARVPHPVAGSKDPQKWLCSPMLAASKNPCELSTETTSVDASGTRTILPLPPVAAPQIDCFYVYPTVSTETTLNANLTIQPAETYVAQAQVSRFSQECRVFAPVYRQVTLDGLLTAAGILGVSGTSKGQKVAYAGVLAAWKDYLTRYNDGRGFVLIGHSQGSFLLRELIHRVIDPNPSLRRHLVSAILAGGNVLVPTGKVVGGDFAHIPGCQSASQTGCVVAYSTFNTTPPANSLFGETTVRGDQVLCTNPAALTGGSGALSPYVPTFGGYGTFADGVTATPWVTYPGLLTAQCETQDGATWLNVSEHLAAGDTRPVLQETLGPTWGLHLYDINVALGNLVSLVRTEAGAYLSSTGSDAAAAPARLAVARAAIPSRS